VVLRSKTSSGTVSLIRQELRAAIPLYRNRNIPSGTQKKTLCAPFACRDNKFSDEKIGQMLDKIGGSGRNHRLNISP
jgi:hypothetical protein